MSPVRSGVVTFPLKAWIDEHEDAPHHLSHSGMGTILESLRRALQHPEPAEEASLRDEIAQMVGVRTERLFLTHGATEANALALGFLAERARRAGKPNPACAVSVPEYPPLADAARWAGFRVVDPNADHEVAVLSDPNNPTGLSRTANGLRALADDRSSLVIDETFRPFTPRTSIARRRYPRVWTLGSFTKVFGGDDLRVGYVIAPPEGAEEFDRFHSVVLDDIPDASVALGRAVVRDHRGILKEAREIFRANLAVLRREIEHVPNLEAPVHFDRGPGPWEGDRVARSALKAGVLVCPGSFFGDPSGVRICLTQRSFPADLGAYLAVRARLAQTDRRPHLTPGRSPATRHRSRVGP